MISAPGRAPLCWVRCPVRGAQQQSTFVLDRILSYCVPSCTAIGLDTSDVGLIIFGMMVGSPWAVGVGNIGQTQEFIEEAQIGVLGAQFEEAWGRYTRGEAPRSDVWWQVLGGASSMGPKNLELTVSLLSLYQDIWCRDSHDC